MKARGRVVRLSLVGLVVKKKGGNLSGYLYLSVTFYNVVPLWEKDLGKCARIHKIVD